LHRGLAAGSRCASDTADKSEDVSYTLTEGHWLR